MVLGTNIDHEHICFIDTPGYNPSEISDGYTNEDVGTAKEFLTNTDTFIWLVGADVNGTIPSSDLDFLSDLNLEDKKLYIILNKADLRSNGDIEDILEEIEETLDDYDIDVIGISAYSSVNKKEYAFKKVSINDFIDDCNIEAKIHKDLVLKLYEVYTMYKKALLTTIKEKHTVKSQLKSISLDLLQEGLDDMNNLAFQRLDNLNSFFTTKKEEENLKLLDSVTKKLKSAIDIVFEKKTNIDTKEIHKDEITIDFDFSVNQDKSIENIQEKKLEEDLYTKKLDTCIDSLGLSTRSFNTLNRSGIKLVRDVVFMSSKDLKNVKNLGKKSYDEIVEKLQELGLK